MQFETVDSIQEEIDELEIRAKDTALSPAQQKDIKEMILAKGRHRRILAARETWIIVAYTVFLAFLFSLIPIYAHNLTRDCIIRQLFYVGSAGGLGGVVYSILGFTYHYDKGDFNLRYKWWYFFRPITAVILGVFAFFFVAGGLMSLSTSTVDIPEGICSSVKGIMFYCAMAFLAGLSTNAFVKKLNDLAGTLFKNEADTRKELDDGKTELKKAMNELKTTQTELADAPKKIEE